MVGYVIYLQGLVLELLPNKSVNMLPLLESSNNSGMTLKSESSDCCCGLNKKPHLQ